MALPSPRGASADASPWAAWNEAAESKAAIAGARRRRERGAYRSTEVRSEPRSLRIWQGRPRIRNRPKSGWAKEDLAPGLWTLGPPIESNPLRAPSLVPNGYGRRSRKWLEPEPKWPEPVETECLKGDEGGELEAEGVSVLWLFVNLS